MSKFYKRLIFNIIAVTLVFFVTLFINGYSLVIFFENYFFYYLFFLTVHILISLATRKFEEKRHRTYFIAIFLYTKTWIFTSGLILSSLYAFSLFSLSRGIVVSTLLSTIIIEYILVSIKYFFKFLNSPKVEKDIDHHDENQKIIEKELNPDIYSEKEYINIFIETIVKRLGFMEMQFMIKIINAKTHYCLLLSSILEQNLNKHPKNKFNCLIFLSRINDIRRINKYFEAANKILPEEGIIIVNAEIYEQTKKRVMKKFPVFYRHIIYSFYYFFKRVIPKLPIIKNIYFFLTKGRSRALSITETLGRLCSCGFEIVKTTEISGKIYVVAKKISEPDYNMNPTYGPIIKLNRVGKGGKLIKVYKFRTMHAYSEYIQSYVHKLNGLDKGGKFKDDFRVTTLGKIMRKLWLDELPMLWNIIKGDMKFVGVRPLSSHFFSLYSEELKQKRIKFKPGLIPPYYVDMPKSMEEIEASELKYLNSYEKNPLFTDIKYFFLAMYNIIIKRARSH